MLRYISFWDFIQLFFLIYDWWLLVLNWNVFRKVLKKTVIFFHENITDTVRYKFFVGDAPLTLTVKSVGSKLHNQDGDLNTLNTIRSLWQGKVDKVELYLARHKEVSSIQHNGKEWGFMLLFIKLSQKQTSCQLILRVESQNKVEKTKHQIFANQEITPCKSGEKAFR